MTLVECTAVNCRFGRVGLTMCGHCGGTGWEPVTDHKGPVPVTQADCDAAGDYLESIGERTEALRARNPVSPQGGPLSQAFARHRTEALREAGELSAAPASEEEIERVARVICAAGGRDPDQLTYHTVEPGVQEPYGPAWCHFEEEARAAIAALSRPSSSADAMEDWLPIEAAPRDGDPFLATTMVCHVDGRQWRETHLIWCDDETGEVHPDCERGWQVEDYSYCLPLNRLVAALDAEQGGSPDA